MIPVLGRGPRTVLEIAYLHDRRGESPRIRFRMVGREDLEDELEIEAREIGLPDNFDELLARSRLPELDLWQLHSKLRKWSSWEHGFDEPLWVALAAPRALTALVPWGRLLGLGCFPFGWRVFRAPQAPLMPVVAGRQPRMALCVNVPSGLDPSYVLHWLGAFPPYLFDQILDGLGRVSLFLHIASEEVQAAEFISSHPLFHSAEVFIDTVPSHPDDEGDSSGRDQPVADVHHPWLRWVKLQLSGRRVDRLVFLSDAKLFPGRAALALGYHRPGGSPGTGLVRAEEVDLFATQLGACRIDLQPLRAGWTELAFRLFAEQLSWMTPAPIVLFEPRSSWAGPWDCLLSNSSNFENASPAEIYAAESKWPTWDVRPTREREILESLTLAGEAGREQFESDNAPAWIVSAQRMLERQASGLLRDDFTAVGEPSPEYRARREGIEQAMRGIVALIRETDRHVGKSVF